MHDDDGSSRVMGGGGIVGIGIVSGKQVLVYGSARLWDDGIIDPRDTCKILSLCLAIAAEADARILHPNTFGTARL
jgi:hypothetical protein